MRLLVGEWLARAKCAAVQCRALQRSSGPKVHPFAGLNESAPKIAMFFRLVAAFADKAVGIVVTNRESLHPRCVTYVNQTIRPTEC